MTDRELLVMAAKARGYWDAKFNCPADVPIGWNPLERRSDAFDLSVYLGIAVTPYPIYEWPKHSVVASRKSLDDSATEVVEPYGDDPEAATMRAITRSAAEIGKAMP